MNNLPNADIPQVTVIRPCKGKEPYLYECLASTFRQTYPNQKLTIYLCISSRQDAACATITRVLEDFPNHDARLFVEEEDPKLKDDPESVIKLGPNPKIRNMSRAYREAKGDLVWILDCNVWLNSGACGRMVDRLNGYKQGSPAQPFKFVHHIPIAVDVSEDPNIQHKDTNSYYEELPILAKTEDFLPEKISYFGGRLDEAFLSSAHAKMYVAINTVAIAPCICGKSSMFRRSHLNALTNTDHSTDTRFGSGIDFFSENICEDHLIGDLLWKSKVPHTMPRSATAWRNHGLVYGDLATQPVADMSISNYIARRVRWLRVRKFTVPAATLVEPGTESFLCSAIGAFGATTWSRSKFLFGNSWLHTTLLWIVSVAVWIAVDWTVYILLQSGRTTETSQGGNSVDKTVPSFACPLTETPFRSRRPFWTWLKSWFAREALALPIWTWAIWGGATVVWRDKKLWVGLDMKVHEVNGSSKQPIVSANIKSGSNGKTSIRDSNKERQE